MFWVRAGELGFVRGAPKAAYLVAFFLIHGRWPEPLGLHGCDNRLCCNPLNPEQGRHVHEGTYADNVREMIERGRNVVYRGGPKVATRASAKLTDAQIAEIRSRYVPGQKPSHADLAREYGMSRSAIGFITRGETYKGRVALAIAGTDPRQHETTAALDFGRLVPPRVSRGDVRGHLGAEVRPFLLLAH